jgi:2-amino-4-hydroxy-6-hydroxymethyldihydropteridine diphosphokinase
MVFGMTTLPGYEPKIIVPKKDRPLVKVFLGLGSNLGKREEFIQKAVELLKRETDFINLKVSDVIETDPVGKTDQGKFLNAVCQFETKLDPRTVFQKTKKIEEQIGQKAKVEWGPREIDIDFLFYGSEIVIEEDLTVPHPLVQDRLFVLRPMNQLDSEFEHPILGLTIREMLANAS